MDSTISKLMNSIRGYYAVWEEISKGLSPDPYRTDGEMMNWVREKIIASKAEVRAYHESNALPMPIVCMLPDPPLMSADYIVDANVVLKAARLLITAMKRSKEYADYMAIVGAMPVAKRANPGINPDLLHVLEQAEKANDAFMLRKHVSKAIVDTASADRAVTQIVERGKSALNKIK